MKLNKSLEGEKVNIVDIDGEIFEGVVLDYIYPEDNEPEGIAAIDIYKCPQRAGQGVSFYETDIKSIVVIA